MVIKRTKVKKQPSKNKKDVSLDKDELIRLSIHDVTDEAKKRLFNTVRIIGIAAGIMLTIITAFAITSVNDAIKKAVQTIVGTDENPSERVTSQIKYQVEKKIGEHIETIKPDIRKITQSRFMEMSEEFRIDISDIEEEISRLTDYKFEEINSNLSELIEDAKEETKRRDDYILEQILLEKK